MAVNIKDLPAEFAARNRAYYAALGEEELCDCGYCVNFRRRIREAEPQAAAYLAALGVDIAKPFETSPIELEGEVEYLSCDYVVLGAATAGFNNMKIGELELAVTELHPDTGVKDEHFVLALGPVRLPWRE